MEERSRASSLSADFSLTAEITFTSPLLLPSTITIVLGLLGQALSLFICLFILDLVEKNLEHQEHCQAGLSLAVEEEAMSMSSSMV